MKTFAYFWVTHVEPANEVMAKVADFRVFAEIVDIVRKHWEPDLRRADDPNIQVNVYAEVGDPALVRVLELLAGVGLKPFYGVEMPEKLVGSQFIVSLLREYSPEECDAAEYFWIDGWGYDDDDVAKLEYVGGAPRGKCDTANWELTLGSVSNESRRFVSDTVKTVLERSNLSGLQFRLLQWDRPEAARARYWELQTTKTMPACLLAVTKVLMSKRLDGNHEYGTMYDDGSFRPTEPVFMGGEVRSMGDFDIAVTREELYWPLPNRRTWYTIISQRFRRLLLKEGLEDKMVLRMVRLID